MITKESMMIRTKEEILKGDITGHLEAEVRNMGLEEGSMKAIEITEIRETDSRNLITIEKITIIGLKEDMMMISKEGTNITLKEDHSLLKEIPEREKNTKEDQEVEVEKEEKVVEASEEVIEVEETSEEEEKVTGAEEILEEEIEMISEVEVVSQEAEEEVEEEMKTILYLIVMLLMSKKPKKQP